MNLGSRNRVAGHAAANAEEKVAGHVAAALAVKYLSGKYGVTMKNEVAGQLAANFRGNVSKCFKIAAVFRLLSGSIYEGAAHEHLDEHGWHDSPFPGGNLSARLAGSTAGGTFYVNQDEAAFAELIRRHGPMVLSTCRHVLRHEQDAEDAFQAAFLVLARKAGSIRKHDSVGGWLYQVAFRLSLRTR